jgi:quercetin dioxygenase-like cupin family protein
MGIKRARSQPRRRLHERVKTVFRLAVITLAGTIQAASAKGAPNVMVPAGVVTSDAISTDGTDPHEWDPRQDGTVAAPGNHKILYEDDDVRVLLVTVRPKEEEPQHHHRWQSIMVVLSGGGVQDFDSTGRALPQAPLPTGFKPPMILRWLPEATHSVHNVNAVTSFRAIRIEYKHGFPKE